MDTPFDKKDILLATLADKHTLYKGKIGHKITDLIWNYNTAYIINCRQRNTTPLPPESIFRIKSQTNRILKTPTPRPTNTHHTPITHTHLSTK